MRPGKPLLQAIAKTMSDSLMLRCMHRKGLFAFKNASSFHD
jgi:hypothetical protein